MWNKKTHPSIGTLMYIHDIYHRRRLGKCQLPEEEILGAAFPPLIPSDRYTVVDVYGTLLPCTYAQGEWNLDLTPERKAFFEKTVTSPRFWPMGAETPDLQELHLEHYPQWGEDDQREFERHLDNLGDRVFSDSESSCFSFTESDSSSFCSLSPEPPTCLSNNIPVLDFGILQHFVRNEIRTAVGLPVVSPHRESSTSPTPSSLSSVEFSLQETNYVPLENQRLRMYQDLLQQFNSEEVLSLEESLPEPSPVNFL